MENKRTATFNRFSIDMTLEQAMSASHSGDCESDVLELLRDPLIDTQLKAIPDEDLAEELKGYGAWSTEELSDVQANRERITWIAASDIRDEEKDDG